MAAAAGASLVDPGPVLAGIIEQTAQSCEDPHALGQLVATLPLSRAGGLVQPFGVKIGGPGLDARSNTDLSGLQADRLTTPTEQVYVRTECPPAVVARREPWTIRTSGLLARAGAVPLDDVSRRARPMGAHLLECSGNNNPANFGLMSVAEWDGVPLAEVVSTLRPSSDSHRGSRQRRRSRSAVEDVHCRRELGVPARVTRIARRLSRGSDERRVRCRPITDARCDWRCPAGTAAPGSSGWTRFGSSTRRNPPRARCGSSPARTHQTAVHELARDYAPPVIQTAATPVRVEKRRGAAGLEYRVVGIVWGGARAVDRLAIRFGDDEPWKPFDSVPRAQKRGDLVAVDIPVEACRARRRTASR